MKLQPKVRQKLQHQQKLSQHQRYALTVLAMNDMAFMAEAQRIVEENPLLEWAEVPEWGDGGDGYEVALNTIAATETLQDVLMAQVYWSGFAYSNELAEFLIASLDNDGYLRVDNEEIARLFHLKSDEVSEAIKALQNLEPAGVFARNVQECILIQLNRKGGKTAEVAKRMVSDCFPDLAQHHYEAIGDALGLEMAEVHQAMKLIMSLEPRPGARYAKGAAVIYPDARIEVEEGVIHVELIRRTDRFTISERYQNVADDAARAYIKKKMREAQLFLDSFAKRCNTLLAIITFVCEYQKDYFVNHGALKSLTMRQCAQEIGFHESTISRAVAHKVIEFENRMIVLRDFFPRPVNGNSRSLIVTSLKEWIHNEDKLHPYSDAQLVELLQGQGIAVSRRTIAKYREQCRIANAQQRKRRVGCGFIEYSGEE